MNQALRAVMLLELRRERMRAAHRETANAGSK
jgi:hypothetical protein